MNIVLNVSDILTFPRREVESLIGEPIGLQLNLRTAADFGQVPRTPHRSRIFLVTRWGRPDIDELIGGLERWNPSPNPHSPDWSLIGLIGADAFRFDPIPKELVERDANLSRRLDELERRAYLVPWNEGEAAHLFAVTRGQALKVAELRRFYLEYARHTPIRKAQ